MLITLKKSMLIQGEHANSTQTATKGPCQMLKLCNVVFYRKKKRNALICIFIKILYYLQYLYCFSSTLMTSLSEHFKHLFAPFPHFTQPIQAQTSQGNQKILIFTITITNHYTKHRSLQTYRLLFLFTTTLLTTNTAKHAFLILY